MMKKIKLLQGELLESKNDYFILPNCDEFFFEYLPESEKRIQFLTGFTGSNAILIVGVDSLLFFTDGRYILQAKDQLKDGKFEVVDMAEKPLFSWLSDSLRSKEKIAIDGRLFSVEFVMKLRKIIEDKGCDLVLLDGNPVDKIWGEGRPKRAKSAIFRHDLRFCGVSFEEKIADLVKNMSSEALFLADSASICWLLNIRANDVEYSPLLAAYAFVYRDGGVEVFVPGGFELLDFDGLEGVDFIDSMPVLRGGVKTVEIDPKQTNYAFYEAFLRDSVDFVERENPIMLKKAQKNEIEIENARKAHKMDGLAVVKFLFWLENALKNGENVDEMGAAAKLLEFRGENTDFRYPSFGSISGFAGNGAIIHYQANDKTNKEFSGDSLYLIDSGGQYFQGTTDVTRTILVGEASEAMKLDFTLVLKGHISLAQAKFDEETTAQELDLLARGPLLENGKDYAHGTGHGVGSFLSVHEGPVSISKRLCKHGLKPGMILSNEPGFYKENDYGIRIENLVLVNKIGALMEFETLTLAPIDYNLVDEKMLNFEEKKWLFNYHKKIFLTYKDEIDDALKAYLERFCEKYQKFLK